MNFSKPKGTEVSSVALSKDILGVIGGYLTLETLEKLPGPILTKASFQAPLERWLSGLKEWKGEETARIVTVNTIAERLFLDNLLHPKYLHLSSPDNNKPAPWCWGLSIVTLQLVVEVEHNRYPTALKPFLYVPEIQIFHLYVTQSLLAYHMSQRGSLLYAPSSEGNTLANRLWESMVSPVRLNGNEGKLIPMMDAYTSAGKGGAPPVVFTTIDNFVKYKESFPVVFEQHKVVYGVWMLMELDLQFRKYVRFGEVATKQMLVLYDEVAEKAKMIPGAVVWLERLEPTKKWLEDQSKV